MATYLMLSDQGERVTSISSIHLHYSGAHPCKKKVTDPHIVIEVFIAEVIGRNKELYNIQRETLKHAIYQSTKSLKYLSLICMF